MIVGLALYVCTSASRSVSVAAFATELIVIAAAPAAASHRPRITLLTP
jgi:hypothetical protein